MYTVIIPAAADAPYTLDALASIYAQDLPPERVIVLVNGRDVSGSRVARDVAEHYPQVELVECPGVGMVPAVNLGIGLTATEYVAFLDTDDIWSPDKQRRQIDALRDDPGIHAAFGLATNFRSGPSGERVALSTAPAKTFTNTTFPVTTFERFGTPDPEATHFGWLYRWWGDAHLKGIRSVQVDSVTLWRRIHGENSWMQSNDEGKRILFAELRRHMREREDIA